MYRNMLLHIDSLKVTFTLEQGVATAVDRISFSIKESETLGIVGESGSGKSVTALSILRLLPQPHGRISDGKIIFEGKDLLKFDDFEMRGIRGNKISMIFQDPMSSLNPVYTVGNQLSESFKLHQKMSKKAAFEKSIEMLNIVGIPSPEERVLNYPYQLSGGMCQRVMIAMAIACQPKLMLADEPTTALDVTIQKQILKLMREMQNKFGTSIILITHNLGIIAEMAKNVIVMYAGSILEYAPVRSLFEDPRHPYTKGLLKAIPRPDVKIARLSIIPGIVPNPLTVPSGCKFHNRCEHSMKICAEKDPPEKSFGDGHLCKCWLYC